MATIEQLKQVILNKIQDLVSQMDDPAALERLSQSLENMQVNITPNLNQLTSNLDANFYYIKNLPNPIDRHDAATKDYVDDAIGSGFQNKFTDDVNANSYKIRNLGEPVVSTDAATKGYVDTGDNNIENDLTTHIDDSSNPHQVTLEQARSVNNQLAGDIDANGNLVKNLGAPTDNNDAATKGYVDTGDNNIENDLTTHIDDNNNPHQVTLEQARNVNNQLAGDIDANNHTIINLTKPVNDTEPVRKADFNLWSTKANMPTARDGLTSSIYNTDIYAIGGYHPGALNTNEQYDVSTNTWTTKASMPTARNVLTSSIYDTDIYAIGGSNSSTNEQYNVSTDTWTTKASMPTARSYLTSSIYNTDIYVIGGSNSSGVLDTNEQYNVSTDTWTTKASMPTARTYNLTSSIYNTDIYAIGGYNTGVLDTNEQYNVSTDTWTTKASMPTARHALTSSIYNTDIYAIGGGSTNEQYNVSTDTWTTKASMPTARSYLTSSIYNTDIYVIGGSNSSGRLSTNEVMIIGGGI